MMVFWQQPEYGKLNELEKLVVNNKLDQDGQSALVYACQKGHFDCAEYLLNHRANLIWPHGMVGLH